MTNSYFKEADEFYNERIDKGYHVSNIQLLGLIIIAQYKKKKLTKY